MKLLLISKGLGALRGFVGADPASLKLLFIPTAGSLDEDPWWVHDDSKTLHEMGFQVTELDIAGKPVNEIESAARESDVVYIAGGNTFYLQHQLNKTGFGEVLKRLVGEGKMYVGASAGAIVAGPSLKPIESLDEPEKVPELKSEDGLGLVDFVVIPHSTPARAEKIDKIRAQYGSDYELLVIDDAHAVIVDGGDHKEVASAD